MRRLQLARGEVDGQPPASQMNKIVSVFLLVFDTSTRVVLQENKAEKQCAKSTSYFSNSHNLEKLVMV